MKKITYLFLFATITFCNAQCWDKVAVGNTHALGIKSDGTLWSWGDDQGWGKLGQGIDSNDLLEPTQIGTASNWETVCASNTHSVAIKTDGTLWVWGGNNLGQLGLGHTNNINIPTQLGTSTWKAAGISQAHTLAIKTDGTLWAWGFNENSALGDGTLITKNSPVMISSNTDWKEVSAGLNRSIAIKNNGTLWTWGMNSSSLGLGFSYAGITYITTPTQIGTDMDWKTAVVGFGHTLAIKQNNTLWGCGANHKGQLGNGTTTYSFLLIQIGTDTDWDKVDVALFTSSGTKTNNTLWGWGENVEGQIGNNTIVDATSPVQITTNTNWKNSSTGQFFTLALNNDGSLYAWGDNNYGQLGNGTTTDQLTPSLVNECTLGVEESLLNEIINLHPNPTKDDLTIEVKNTSTYELYALNGILLKKGSLQNGANQVTLESLATGCYIIKVSDDIGNVRFEKVVKE